MIRFLFYILVCCGLILSVSCKDSHDKHIKFEIEHETKLYHQAIKFGDVGTAIHAMQSLLVWDSTKKDYYDTLALLYFHSQNYPQAIQSAQVILDKQPDNIKLLQIVAHSCQYLGRQDLAIPYFTKVADKQPGPAINYEIASCYFFARDFKKVTSYIDKIMADKSSDTVKVNITFNQGHDQQDVPVKAACYNLLGTLAMNVNIKDQALTNYKNALKIFPDFELAKQNIDYIEKGDKSK